MEYYIRFSVIEEGYGLMGIEDVTVDCSPEELKDKLDEFYAAHETGTTTYMLDEIYDEEGNEVSL